MHHLTRPFVVVLALLLLAACSPPGESPLQQGAINLVVSGLPQGTNANVTVSGPGFSQTFNSNAQIPNLTPGQYTISASPVTANGTSYQPNPASQSVEVVANGTATATVAYSADDAGPGPGPGPGPGATTLNFSQAVPDTIAGTGFTLVQGGNQFSNE